MASVLSGISSHGGHLPVLYLNTAIQSTGFKSTMTPSFKCDIKTGQSWLPCLCGIQLGYLNTHNTSQFSTNATIIWSRWKEEQSRTENEYKLSLWQKPGRGNFVLKSVLTTKFVRQWFRKKPFLTKRSFVARSDNIFSHPHKKTLCY